MSPQSSSKSLQSFGLHWILFRYAAFTSFVALVVFFMLPQYKVPGMVVVVIALGMWLEAGVRYASMRLTVDEHSLWLTLGLWNKVQRTILREAIVGVDVEQSWLGKLLGYGQLSIQYHVEEEEGMPLFELKIPYLHDAIRLQAQLAGEPELASA